MEKLIVYPKIPTGLLRDEEAFLAGFKPALYTLDSKYIGIYPVFIERCPKRDKYFYFQSEDQRQRFSDQLEKIAERDSDEYHELIGLTLGFPPQAVKDYLYFRHNLYERRIYKIGMSFAGIDCGCHIDNVHDCVRWLWDTYPYPSEENILHIGYKGKEFPIEYNCFEKLDDVLGLIKNKIKQTILVNI
ncbi:hypothetical protein [Thermoflavimicrobium daqui]|uniref:Uncharacterized protein n=1 Tax=Thermoflavimicrobium daqui TaxID=2137476 RepID=A0A364K1U8_9BACL|nr:hypothetical protein [Thermoflavimicrobium daqui]RAL21999.1 hypothetical protein DL897_15570 [Thermoflavimicrobium daqui]